MSMPQDLMQMLMGGGGIKPPLLSPNQTQPTPPPQQQMGPEEQAAMAMFNPPGSPEEEEQGVQNWTNWAQTLKKEPGWANAMAAFGAAIAQPGGLAQNFTKAAAVYMQTLDESRKQNKQQELQKFGVIQQARGIDAQNKQTQTQLQLSERAQKLNEDQFGLSKIESEANRFLALEGLGIKKRELALATSSAKTSEIGQQMQNKLLEAQVKKIEKDINSQGVFETTPGEPLGTTYVKTRANALIAADPKVTKDTALAQAMQEYTAISATISPTGGVTPKDVFNATIKLEQAKIASAMPGAMSVDSSTIVNKAMPSGVPATPAVTTEATPQEVEKVKSVATAQGYTIVSVDPKTRTAVVKDKSGVEKQAKF